MLLEQFWYHLNKNEVIFQLELPCAVKFSTLLRRLHGCLAIINTVELLCLKSLKLLSAWSNYVSCVVFFDVIGLPSER
jgi:hypothetical protein